MQRDKYELVYLPKARKDLVDAVSYVASILQNHAAADKLATKLIEAIEEIIPFPYANPLYVSSHPLKREYRKLAVDNYLVFYWVDESSKTITIARVVYGRRNHEDLLE